MKKGAVKTWVETSQRFHSLEEDGGETVGFGRLGIWVRACPSGKAGGSVGLWGCRISVEAAMVALLPRLSHALVTGEPRPCSPCRSRFGGCCPGSSK